MYPLEHRTLSRTECPEIVAQVSDVWAFWAFSVRTRPLRHQSVASLVRLVAFGTYRLLPCPGKGTLAAGFGEPTLFQRRNNPDYLVLGCGLSIERRSYLFFRNVSGNCNFFEDPRLTYPFSLPWTFNQSQSPCPLTGLFQKPMRSSRPMTVPELPAGAYHRVAEPTVNDKFRASRAKTTPFFSLRFRLTGLD